MEYREEDFLQLSGIQHFAFCRRQWALIHIEQQWQENLRTIEGAILHERAHDKFFTEKRGEILVSRAMPIFSRRLGLSGECDVVELHSSPNGVSIFGRDGLYLPIPIEYKRGKPKENDADVLQLCAQAMCLEEMLLCNVDVGYLFYGRTNRRTEVSITDQLRNRVGEMTEEMHRYYKDRYTPKVKPTKACSSCSLKDVCIPKLSSIETARHYIQRRIKEGIE